MTKGLPPVKNGIGQPFVIYYIFFIKVNCTQLQIIFAAASSLLRCFGFEISNHFGKYICLCVLLLQNTFISVIDKFVFTVPAVELTDILADLFGHMLGSKLSHSLEVSLAACG